jgi:hypothetical protein
MLPDTIPTWIAYDQTPRLNEEGIGGVFLRVTEMKRFALNEENNDLLDAFEIAERITGSADIGQRLRQTRIREDKRAKDSNFPH